MEYNYKELIKNYPFSERMIAIDKTFVMSSIMRVKHKYLNQNYITYDELYFITTTLRDILSNEGSNDYINERVDTNIFSLGEVITINPDSNVTYSDIDDMCPLDCSIGSIIIIYDEGLIFDLIQKSKLEDLKQSRTAKVIFKKSYKKINQ